MKCGPFLCLLNRVIGRKEDIVENEHLNQGGASAPSADEQRALRGDDLDIDAAIAAAQERMNRTSTEQEQDDDEIEGQATTTEGEPDVRHDENSGDTDEDKTPDNTTQRTVTSSQEPQKKEESDDEDLPPMSRKQRGKLIQEIRSELDESERKRKELEATLAEQTANEEKLTAEVNRALGTDEEYEKANDEGLAGDDEQAKRARVFKANRAFFKKLVDKAQRDTEKGFYSAYWEPLKDLPGIKPEVLQHGTLGEILKHSYEAGVASVQDAGQEEVQKLQDRIITLQGKIKSLQPKSGAGQIKSPMGGGGDTPVVAGASSWRQNPRFIKDGMLTDEAESIVRRYGFDALNDPSLIKAR